jgi:hypothetical protein
MFCEAAGAAVLLEAAVAKPARAAEAARALMTTIPFFIGGAPFVRSCTGSVQLP